MSGLTTTYKEYSEYELEEIAVKVGTETTHTSMGAVGSCEESLDSKTVTKKYKGIEAKSRTKGAGTGELKLSMHVAYDKYNKAMGMDGADLKTGVVAYGTNSTHQVLSIVMKVTDEDGTVKYKAYPNAMIKTGISRKIENASESVAEVELTIAVMPDEYGYGVYEALESGMDADLKTKWMTEFESSLAQKTTT